MRPIYLYRDEKDFSRKILTDMPYLSSHKMIRIPKYQFEEGLYLIIPDSGSSKKYYLTTEMLLKEDADYMYFAFPVKNKEIGLLEQL